MSEYSFLPSPDDLALLPPENIGAMISLADKLSKRQTFYASLALTFGFLSFIGCLLFFSRLLLAGHRIGAASVLITGILAIVTRFINARLGR